ncbi:hypothetical protein HOG16_02310 [Candidatus Woesearchaeota archaeon]|jgi:hypothetical protein|nr:hypothetical protein [Candidatus Woesearchaeota archaeon]MBT4321812.1 hypothetical protein [Candidatus Woesearchaeota archaeon]
MLTPDIHSKRVALEKLLDEYSSLERQLVISIREYSLSQSGLWLKVPNLALEAQGRGGYSDSYNRAFSSGYWSIDSSIKGGVYTIYVDLSNGELISPFLLEKKGKERLAWDERVLEITSNIDEINAESIITDLTTQAKSKYESWQKPKEIEEWRKERKKEIPKIFRNK